MKEVTMNIREKTATATSRSLKKLIFDQHMSIVRLSKLLNLGSTTDIYRWLSGEKIPSVIRLVQLSEIFGVTVDYLLGKEN